MEPAPPARVHLEVEHLFRHQAGQMLATLTRIFGWEHLDLVEDVVQEALLQALRQWPFSGIPANPRAWLIQVARNKALDALRRRASLRRIEQQLHAQLMQFQPAPDPGGALNAGVCQDDQLAMIFACCHPFLPAEARVALTLKVVSCLSVPEIARAFLAEPATIAQRLVRAKRRLREAGIALTLPEEGFPLERVGSVLQVLYLLFNEGYSAHAGENLVREELCAEAIRLAEWLASHPAAAAPRVHALLALFYLQAARLPTRLDGDGNLLLLADQDRSRWDRNLLRRGLQELERSAEGTEVSEYHLQAGIAAVHATSNSFAETDWPYLLTLYDGLQSLTPSPVVVLNRAIVLGKVKGPEAGLRAVAALKADPAMKGYRWLPAVEADFLCNLGRTAEAAAAYRQVLAHSCTQPERRFLEQRLACVEETLAPRASLHLPFPIH